MTNGEFQLILARFDNLEDGVERIERKIDTVTPRVNQHEVYWNMTGKVLKYVLPSGAAAVAAIWYIIDLLTQAAAAK